MLAGAGLVDVEFVVVTVPDGPTPAIAPSLAEVALAVEGVTVGEVEGVTGREVEGNTGREVEGITVREVERVSVEGFGVVVVAGIPLLPPADFQLKSTGTAEHEAYRTEEWTQLVS